MVKFDEVCESIVANVAGAVACGLVDLSSGQTIAQNASSNGCHPIDQQVKDTLRTLLSGMRQMEQSLPATATGASAPDAEREVYMTTASNRSIAISFEDGSKAALLLIDESTILGSAWAHLRASIPSLKQ